MHQPSAAIRPYCDSFARTMASLGPARISLGQSTIDRQPYVIATWPSAADANGAALAGLADQLEGELLD